MKAKILKFLKDHWRGVFVSFLAFLFFISLCFLNRPEAGAYVKWSSPDETANYIFTKLYSETGEVSFFERYNLYADDVMHPRSMRSDAGTIKPVSFLGIILIYGGIASVFGSGVIPFLTPFFASLGIVFFYLLIRRVFGKTNAMVSALLLSGFPVWIYYSERSMFHNVLFVSLLIVGLYFSLGQGEELIKRKFLSRQADWIGMLYASLAGLFTGAAALARTSELLWVAPLFFLLWIFNIKKAGLIKVLLFLSFAFLSLLPALYWNQLLYGAPFSGGYAEMNSSLNNIRTASSELAAAAFAFEPGYVKYLFGRIQENIFYFGFHPRQSAEMFFRYFVDMFAWFFYPACLGLFLFLQRIHSWKKSVWLFFISYFVISSILVLYYGSWEFHDNPNAESFTIGNSYTRYWLPVYLGALPLASFFLIRLTCGLAPERADGVFKEEPKAWLKKILSRPRRKFVTLGLRALFLGVIFLLSANFVLLGSEEGLIYGLAEKKYSFVQLKRVLEETENNSVIITQYHDKLFFPERKVIVGNLTDNNMNKVYADLAQRLPVYYYSFVFPETDLDYLNTRKLFEAGLRIESVKKITEDFTLYKLILADGQLESGRVAAPEWREEDLLKHISSKLIETEKR